MKKGFTLIELLATIVILAIIALIAVPIVINIIRDTNEKSFKESINGIVKSAIFESTMKIKDEELLYKYENNNWVEFKLNIDGETPKYVEIKVNKEGQVRYAITDGEYCAMKEYDEELTIKKIGKEIRRNRCKLDLPEPTDVSCFEYTVSNKKVHITKYKCKSTIKDVVIPDEIDGYPVTEIVSSTFHSQGLKSAIISDSVTYIGSYSFADNKLTSVVVPDSVKTISSYAFRGNELENITIGKKVQSIGSGAFYNNKITSVVIPNGVTIIDSSAFRDNQLSSVVIPDSVITIEDSAFYDSKLTNVTFGNSVTSIGENAFYSNELTSVTIPESVMSIGNSAFYVNPLTSVIIKGKTATSDFTNYGLHVFGAYSDSNIKWQSSN